MPENESRNLDVIVKETFGSIAAIRVKDQLQIKRDLFGQLCSAAWIFQQVILMRVQELGETAIELFCKNKLVSSAVVTRSLLETVALYHYVYCFLVESVERRDPDIAGEVLVRSSFGQTK